jgi:hypothetical protein
MIKFDTDKLSGIFAYLAALGILLSSVATIAGMINPRYGLICATLSGAIASFTKRIHHVGRRRAMPKKFLQSVICLFLAGTILMNSACAPKKISDAVRVAARANRLVKDLVKATEESFDEKLISKETTLKATVFFDKAIPLADKFTDAVENLKAKYGGGAKIPASEFQNLRAAFDAFQAPIEDVLQLFGALSESQRAKLDAAIEAIKTAIEIIKSGFGQAEIYFKEREEWT